MVPSPTIADFRRLVATGLVQRVTVVTQPLTASPVMRWVVAHCKKVGTAPDDPVLFLDSTIYECPEPPLPVRLQVRCVPGVYELMGRGIGPIMRRWSVRAD